MKTLLERLGFEIRRINTPLRAFHSFHYLQHNARRLEHLASLGLEVAGKTVLEVGAGIGDHSHYYLDRGCKVMITEAREDNLAVLRKRYPSESVHQLDLEHPHVFSKQPFEIVHCYGLLYHLKNPRSALEFLAQNCAGIMALETCVSFGRDNAINPIAENPSSPSQARSGTGCRPTRPWILKQLSELFPYVYIPHTQPNHEEFPLDWSAPEKHNASLSRAVFIASRVKLNNAVLLTELPDQQIRHP